LKIAPNLLVDLDYEIKSSDGDLLETSDEAGPMTYLHGSDEIPPKLSDALLGKGVGDELELAFEPGEAFGPYNPDGIVSVPRDDFPADHEIEKGEWIELSIETDDGSEDTLEMRVLDIEPDAVILDANHPLADQAVVFHVKVLEVREQ